MIFTGFFCYYLFRENIKSAKNWGLIILYAVTFVISYSCFSDAEFTESAKIMLFHFARNWVAPKNFVFFYFWGYAFSEWFNFRDLHRQHGKAIVMILDFMPSQVSVKVNKTSFCFKYSSISL